MAVERLTDKIMPWFTEEFEKQVGEAEDFVFEGTIVAGPRGPLFVIVAWMPGAILGTLVQTTVGLNSAAAMTQEDAEGIARMVLDNLAQERTKQTELAQQSVGPDKTVPVPGDIEIPGQ